MPKKSYHMKASRVKAGPKIKSKVVKPRKKSQATEKALKSNKLIIEIVIKDEREQKPSFENSINDYRRESPPSAGPSHPANPARSEECGHGLCWPKPEACISDHHNCRARTIHGCCTCSCIICKHCVSRVTYRPSDDGDMKPQVPANTTVKTNEHFQVENICGVPDAAGKDFPTSKGKKVETKDKRGCVLM